jgi:hypothetical protein
MMLQFAHIENPEDAKIKKPFAIIQMVILTLLIIFLFVLAIVIALISIIKWYYEKSGA